MSLITTDGYTELINRILGNGSSIGSPLKLKLFTNSYIYKTISSLDEPTFTGYASIDLDDWTVNEVGQSIIAAHSEVAFDFTDGDDDIYGYYIETAGAEKIIWAELFTDGPYYIPVGGGSITVKPNIALSI